MALKVFFLVTKIAQRLWLAFGGRPLVAYRCLSRLVTVWVIDVVECCEFLVDKLQFEGGETIEG